MGGNNPTKHGALGGHRIAQRRDYRFLVDGSHLENGAPANGFRFDFDCHTGRAGGVARVRIVVFSLENPPIAIQPDAAVVEFLPGSGNGDPGAVGVDEGGADQVFRPGPDKVSKGTVCFG